MSDRWHRTKDLAGLPGMPNGARPIRQHGARRGWICRETAWGSRTVLEWLESSLPAETQAALRGEGPPASDAPLADRVAVLDARVELVTAFDRWRPAGMALVPALKEWVSLYKESGAGVSAETRAAIPTVAWNTLQRHRHALRKNGSMALMPGRGGRTAALDAEMRAKAEALIRRRPRHITAKQIRRTLAAEFPDRDIPGIASIRRWARKWRAENAWELSANDDPDRHRSHRKPAFGDASADGLNSLWELDSTKIDAMCVDGKRYTLVAGIDVWSRRAKALVAPTSRSESVAALLRRCLLDWGVPEIARTDEGADYVSNHLVRVMADLDVVHDVLPPYRPDKKPFIERFMRTIGHDLFAMLPGFVGHNVADREAIRNRWSFAARRGQARTITFECGLTAEQLQERIDAWCETVYGREPHAGLGGQSPFEREASWTGERKKIGNERALDLLLAKPVNRSPRRMVQKDGIHADGGVYVAGEIGDLIGEWVDVRRDPADYGAVFVFHRTDHPDKRLAGRFICRALDPVRTGIDREAVAREADRRYRERSSRARRIAREQARTEKPEAAMDRVLAKAAADAQKVVALPRAGEEHRTDALDAAAQAGEAAQAAAQAERKAFAGGTKTIFQKLYGGKA